MRQPGFDFSSQIYYSPIVPVLRLKEITGPGLVFVTTTVLDWHQTFKPPQIAREVTQQLGKTASFYNVSIVGYVVMPSHVHILAGLEDISALSSFIQAFKSLSSRRLSKLEMAPCILPPPRTGRIQLWKRRFDDIIIVSEEQFRRKLNYIHDNPVKAGLVKEAIDWAFSSARAWLLDEPGEIEIIKDYRWTCG